MKALAEGKQVHAYIIKDGLEQDIFLGRTLVRMYARCGDVASARQVFDNMSKPGLLSWNAMIAGYGQHGYNEEALELFRQMQLEGVKPDVVSWTAIIAGYVQQGHYEEAIDFFWQMRQEGVRPDVISWNVMIAGYAQHGHGQEALELFRQMEQEGVRPNLVSWNTVIAAYAQHGHCEKAFELLMQMQCEGVKPDVVSWTALIAGHTQHGQGREALKLFHQMQREGVKPNSMTFTSILKACSSLSILEEGKRVHAHIIDSGFKFDLSVGNALVDMYAKSGSIDDARHVFDKMPNRDVASWTAIITGYAQHGRGEEALALFQQMQQEGMKPDHVTFVGVLTACSHVGLVDEGHDYYDSIIQDHGISLSKEHYACMVDLLGRGGCLNEAVDFISRMPFQSDVMLWRTLLGSCRIHGNVKLAECALRLEPDNAALYVLLSSIYAAAGRWDDQALVRKLMKDMGVR